MKKRCLKKTKRISAALIVLLAAFSLASCSGEEETSSSYAEETTLSESTTDSGTPSVSASDSETPSVSTAAESSESASDTAEASSEETAEETAVETSEETTASLVPEGTVVDSSYEAAPGYTWEDMASLFILIGTTSPNLPEGGKYIFSLLSFTDGSSPLFFNAVKTSDGRVTDITVYTEDDGKIYELLHESGPVYTDFESRTVFFPNSGKCYVYVPHCMVMNDFSVLPGNAVEIPFTEGDTQEFPAEILEEYVFTGNGFLGSGGGAR